MTRKGISKTKDTVDVTYMMKMMKMMEMHEPVLPHNYFTNVHIINHRTFNKRKGEGRREKERERTRED